MSRLCPILLSFLTAFCVIAQSQDQPVPFADYHQHLFSPAKAAVVYEPTLPPIKLPTELASLVQAREQARTDANVLATLYTKDALMLNTRDDDAPSWIRGNEAVAKEIAIYFDEPYHITSVAFRIDGATAFVAGYYSVRRADNTESHIAHLYWTLRKQEQKWRIASELPSFPGPPRRDPSNADQLIAQLDEAGIQKAVVLSVAYQWGSEEGCPACSSEEEYAKVKAENDYIAREIGRYRSRLVGFCSFNPLKEYSLQELARCSKLPGMIGLKLHFGNSRVDLRKLAHLEKLQKVFHVANQLRMPIVVHLWTDPSYEKEGAQHARIFLERLLPEAPDVTVQIAHLAGGGRATPLALAVFADAMEAHDSRTKNLYFDTATVTDGENADGLKQDALFMKRIGFNRILYGTDTSPPNPSIRVSWALFKGLVPLSDQDIQTIARNVAPYLR